MAYSCGNGMSGVLIEKYAKISIQQSGCGNFEKIGTNSLLVQLPERVAYKNVNPHS
jgi:hypothetical protein